MVASLMCVTAAVLQAPMTCKEGHRQAPRTASATYLAAHLAEQSPCGKRLLPKSMLTTALLTQALNMKGASAAAPGDRQAVGVEGGGAVHCCCHWDLGGA